MRATVHRSVLLLLLIGFSLGCASPNQTATELDSARRSTLRIGLTGDVMVGRGVATLVARDPDEMFAGVRHLLNGVDVAAANLESPLTERPHRSANQNRLEADPAAAALLGSAGFDVVALANNHSADAGTDGLVDTIDALTTHDIAVVGAGENGAAAHAPWVGTFADLEVGFLAYDATGSGLAAGGGPGVAPWDEAIALDDVRALRTRVDVVVVGIHGGTEYLTVADPGLSRIGDVLAGAGADVVWGTGAHVVQPVTVVAGDRPTLVATSLGNFLFDQAGDGRTTGALLEVLADRSGVIAYRVATTEHADRRVEFVEWSEPAGDAVWVDGAWWTIIRDLDMAEPSSIAFDSFPYGDLTAAALGDIDGDGIEDIVASFRRPSKDTTLQETHPENSWADEQGRSAHVGVYERHGLGEIWVAGSVPRPVAAIEVCDGSIAVAHDALDDATVGAVGAWLWNGFGFDTAPVLRGRTHPACADVDGDGSTDPMALGG